MLKNVSAYSQGTSPWQLMRLKSHVFMSSFWTFFYHLLSPHLQWLMYSAIAVLFCRKYIIQKTTLRKCFASTSLSLLNIFGVVRSYLRHYYLLVASKCKYKKYILASKIFKIKTSRWSNKVFYFHSNKYTKQNNKLDRFYQRLNGRYRSSEIWVHTIPWMQLLSLRLYAKCTIRMIQKALWWPL